MAWDFSTEPEFEEKLEWMREFVRDEIYPARDARPRRRRASGGHRPAEGAGEGRGACGPRTCRPSSAAAASAR